MSNNRNPYQVRYYALLNCRHATFYLASYQGKLYQVCQACGKTKLQKKSLITPERFAKLPILSKEQFSSNAALLKERKTDMLRWEAEQAHAAQDRAPVYDKQKYEEYLNSKEWLEKRYLVFKRAGTLYGFVNIFPMNPKCELCGKNEAVHCHHLTYARLYNEFLTDLVAVCEGCHNRCHPEKGVKS